MTKLKLTLSSHFKVYFFVVLLFSFKITFSFHFKTLTDFCVSHPIKHTMINISVYIFIYIYYTIKFLFCVCHSSFIHLFLKKMREGTWACRRTELSVSGYKIKPLWKPLSCGGQGKNYEVCTLSWHVWLVWLFVVQSQVELPYCLFWLFHRL